MRCHCRWLLALLAGNVIYSLFGSSLIPPEWLSASITPDMIWHATLGQVGQIGIRLTLVFGLGVIIWKLRTGLSLSKASITTNDRSFLSLTAIGILTFSIASLPWKGVVLINQLFPFGEGLHGWDYLNEVSFTPGLVFYILVTAMLLPPILE